METTRVVTIRSERAEFGLGHDDHGLLFCWEDAGRRTPTP